MADRAPLTRAEAIRRLEVAALVRLGLADRLSSLALGDGESTLDALARTRALSVAQVLAVRGYLERNAVTCECGRTLLADDDGALVRCSACGENVARETAGVARPARRARVVAAGDRLGPFELLTLLGEGTSGRVFKARHVELGRVSALKVLPGAALDDTRRRRFEREVVAQARLDHPGLVKIHATFAEAGALAFEMDLVEGESLEAMIERCGTVPWREAARIIAEVARAIDHAHDRDVVHRDVKPANIVIRKDDGRAVLVDLGIARFLDRASSLTQEGRVVGSPAYMAPEAMKGESGPAADIYALGASLYHAVSGELPFEAESLVQLYARVETGDCTPLDAAAAPLELERVRAKAMALDPRRRHARARYLARDLEAIVAGRPTGQRRNLAAPLLLVAVAIAGAVALARWRDSASREATRASLEEVRRLSAADPDAALALLRPLHAAALRDPEAVPDLAELELRLGDAPRAVEALATLPDALRAHEKLLEARALRATGERERALALVGRTGREGIVHASLLIELGRAAEAETLASELSLGPDRADGLLALGEARLAQGDPLGARAAFLEARAAGVPALASAGLAETWLALGAPLDALDEANAAVRAAPLDPWPWFARAGARLLTTDGPGAAADARRAATLGPSLHACREGAALVRDLASHEPGGAWARALVRDARRAANRLIESRTPKFVEDAARVSGEATAVFSASASAHASYSIALYLSGAESDALRALAECEAAHALDPGDRAIEVFRAFASVRRDGVAKALGILDRAATLEDHEAAASGLTTRAAFPSLLLLWRSNLALLAGDPRAPEIARDAVEAAFERHVRCAAVANVSSALIASDAEGAARAALEARWLEPKPAEARALLLHAQDREPRALAARIEREPWEPVHRFLGRFKVHKFPVEDMLDGMVAGVSQNEYAGVGLEAVLARGSLGTVRKRLAEQGFGAGPAQAQPEANAFDPERVVLSPPRNPVEACAASLVRAALALAAVETLSWTPERAGFVALHHVKEAEDVYARTPLIHAYRSLALDLVGAVKEAERERARFAELVPESLVAALAVARASGAEKSEAAKRFRAEVLTVTRSATVVPLLDTSGLEALVNAVDEDHVSVPTRTHVLTPRVFALPAGWALEVRGEEPWLVGTAPGAPLAVDLGPGDELDMEAATGASEGELAVELPGQRFVVDLRRPSGRERIPLAAGLAEASHPSISVIQSQVAIACFFRRSLATEEDSAFLRGQIARATALGGERPRDADLKVRVARGEAPCEVAWNAASHSLRPGDPAAMVDLQFKRLLGRSPGAEEKARWVEALRTGDLARLPRVLCRSKEFQERHGF